MNSDIALAEDILSTVAALTNIERQDVTPETHLSEIGLDSLGLVALIAHLETHHEVRSTDQDAMELFRVVTLSDVITWAAKLANDLGRTDE